ncbi:unnamed protein product, partial [Adineta ricciae]
MRTTRANLNLKQTTIYDHLLSNRQTSNKNNKLRKRTENAKKVTMVGAAHDKEPHEEEESQPQEEKAKNYVNEFAGTKSSQLWKFSGAKNQDAGEWLDHVFVMIE